MENSCSYELKTLFCMRVANNTPEECVTCYDTTGGRRNIVRILRILSIYICIYMNEEYV